MDAQTFDRLVAAAVRRPNRRTALRLFSAAMLGAFFLARAAAQRPDHDEDGLFDDDETDVYFTDPDDWDTDDDNVGDGEEIYNRDNGLGGPSNPLVNDNAAAPPPAENPVRPLPAPPSAEHAAAIPAARPTRTTPMCSAALTRTARASAPMSPRWERSSAPIPACPHPAAPSG